MNVPVSVYIFTAVLLAFELVPSPKLHVSWGQLPGATVSVFETSFRMSLVYSQAIESLVENSAIGGGGCTKLSFTNTWQPTELVA